MSGGIGHGIVSPRSTQPPSSRGEAGRPAQLAGHRRLGHPASGAASRSISLALGGSVCGALSLRPWGANRAPTSAQAPGAPRPTVPGAPGPGGGGLVFPATLRSRLGTP